MASVQPRVGKITSHLRLISDYLRERPRLRLIVLLSLPVTFLTFVFVIPLLIMGWYSFLSDMPPAPLTLENYTRALTSDLYMGIIWRTTIITVQTTIIVTILGYSMAYSLVRFSRRTTLMLVLVILPFWTNYIIRMYAWINILQSGGVLDTLFMWTTLTSEPLGLLYSQTAVLIGFTYIWLPLATLPFYASLTNMDPNLIDAAKDLGAGPLKTFLTVTLPTTMDGIVVGIILVAIPTFGSFITPALLGGTDNVMIGMTIEEQFVTAFNWPFGAALAVIVSVFVVTAMLVALLLGTDLFGHQEDKE